VPNLCRLYFNYLEAGLKIIGALVCLENKQFWVPRYYAFKALPRVILAPRKQNKLQWAMAMAHCNLFCMANTSSSLCNSSAAASNLALLFTILRWWRWPTRVFGGSFILLITVVPPTYWEERIKEPLVLGIWIKWESQNCWQFWFFQTPQIISGFMKEPAGYGWLLDFLKFWRVEYVICFLENHSYDTWSEFCTVSNR